MASNRLWGLDSPTMDIDAAHLVIGASGKVKIPLPSFLVEHDQGLVLFDTGMNPVVCEDPALLFGDRPEASWIAGRPEQRLDTQIRNLSFDISDVTHVVLSHTHCDHAGGLYLFPQAKFFTGPGEFDWARNPDERSAHLFIPEDFSSAKVQSFDWNTVKTPVHDLFGDGSIEVHHMPGHTPGELSMLVRLPNQNIVLTADAVHLREALETGEADPSDWDLDTARETVQRLKVVSAEADARIWISHDPRDWDDFGGPNFELR